MALQGTPGFQYVFLSEPSQSPVIPCYSLETVSELSSAFSPCPLRQKQNGALWEAAWGAARCPNTTIDARRHSLRRHLLLLPALLMSSIFRGVFFRLIFINGHVTGWYHLADGLGKAQSVTFIQTVLFSVPSTPSSVSPLNPLCPGWHSSSCRLWITLGLCCSQDSAFLERADYRSPGKL